MESNAKNGGTTGALWEYEAPQFCDFSDNQTFEPNPEVDSFFFTDHESKENVSSDDSSGSTDLFQTPMTINSDSKNIDSNESEIEPKDLDATPRRSTFCASISKYPLRETPLRQLYVNGGTPMQESRPSKVFGSRRSKHFGSLANQSKTIETPKLAPQLSSSEQSTCGETSTAQTPSKRTTFDVTDHVIEQVKALDMNRGNEDPNPVEEKKEVEEKKVESVSESESVSENVTEKSIQSIEIAPKQQSNGNVSYDLISEDDDDDEDEKEFDKSKSINQTVCVQKQECDEQQSEISSSAAIEPQTNEEIDEDAAEFHPIADADLTEESLEPSISAADFNTSRQSYVVSSPSIRVVHFDERSFIGKNDDDKPQEEEGENQQKITNTTPVGQVEESNRKKIQMRQKTPVPRVIPTTTTSIKNTTNTNTSTTSKNITGARKLFDRAARQKKYIKRFSKNRTLQDGELSGDQAKVDAVSSKLSSNNNKTAMAKPKKRVTIAANISTKTMNNAANGAGGGGGTIVKAKRNLSLKSSTNRTSIFSSSVATSKQNEAKNSPYLGLAVLNYKYMNSFRSIVPINRTNGGNSKTIAKPKLTVPRAPKLMTAARHDARKYHQSLSSSSSRNQKNENATVFRQEKIKSNEKLISATKPKTIIGPDGKLVPKKSTTTKATTPHFASDARIKIWHQKHDNVDGGEGSGATAAAAASSQSHFKARPMPNFKKLQANEDKRKKEAFQKCRATFRTVSTISTASAASEPK